MNKPLLCSLNIHRPWKYIEYTYEPYSCTRCPYRWW